MYSIVCFLLFLIVIALVNGVYVRLTTVCMYVCMYVCRMDVISCMPV